MTAENVQQQFVISLDGTKITYRTEGSGPARLVIPRALSLASNFERFSQELGVHHTVHTVERRGRGESGAQGDDYNIEKKCQDILAICVATGAKFVFGHSYGGFIVLETAKRDPSIQKIALYEPGMSIDGSIDLTWREIVEKQISENRKLEAFVSFIKASNPETTGKAPSWLLKFILWLTMKTDDLKQYQQLLPTTIPEHAELRASTIPIPPTAKSWLKFYC